MDCAGHLSGGWSKFYETSFDVDQGQPHLRTYHGRQSEKFYETFRLPMPPERPAKGKGVSTRASYTWGVGGTQPQGRLRLVPPEAADIANSCKRYLVPQVSGEAPHGHDMGRKAHVFDAAGVDRKSSLSGGYTLEDVLQRKARVPEEARTESRVIHRVAPVHARSTDPSAARLLVVVPILRGRARTLCTPDAPIVLARLHACTAAASAFAVMAVSPLTRRYRSAVCPRAECFDSAAWTQGLHGCGIFQRLLHEGAGALPDGDCLDAHHLPAQNLQAEARRGGCGRAGGACEPIAERRARGDRRRQRRRHACGRG